MSAVNKYYRKISENVDNIKNSIDIASLLIKSQEVDLKIKDIENNNNENLKMINSNESRLNNIENDIDSKFYSKKYLDNELNNYYYKSNIDNKISNLYDNYYDKNHLNLQFNNLYNRTYLDNKFDDIYTKTDVNDINSKLNRNINIFNTNLTNHINSYKNNKKDIDNNIKNIKVKLDKFSYYIKEFFMHNIDFVKRFEITSETDYIQILQFEIDRNLLVDDVIKFLISIKLLYENMSKVYWTLYFKMYVHYKDDALIKSFKKQMTSKGFLFKNLATYNIDNMFKLNKDTDRLISRLYMYKLSTAYKNNVTVTLTNSLEENYCNLIWYRNQ